MVEILLSRYNYFLSFGMKTHLTTNLNSTDIEKIYGLRLRSLMREILILLTCANAFRTLQMRMKKKILPSGLDPCGIRRKPKNGNKNVFPFINKSKPHFMNYNITDSITWFRACKKMTYPKMVAFV